jgi:hypothetical protein
MAKLFDVSGDVQFELNIMKNDRLDVDIKRDHRENWIPFVMNFIAKNERFIYLEDKYMAFTLYELNDLLKNLDLIVRDKSKKKEVGNYEFYCLESYFGMVVYDPLEDNEIYIDFWVNMGSYDSKSSYYYDKGYRFVVELDVLSLFVDDLRNQLEDILGETFCNL